MAGRVGRLLPSTPRRRCCPTRLPGAGPTPHALLQRTSSAGRAGQARWLSDDTAPPPSRVTRYWEVASQPTLDKEAAENANLVFGAEPCAPPASPEAPQQPPPAHTANHHQLATRPPAARPRSTRAVHSAGGAPNLRLRLVDETRLGNHDIVLSFLALSKDEPQHDPAEMIDVYTGGKPLTQGCRVWRVRGGRTGDEDSTYRKFGRVDLIGDDTVSVEFEHPTGVPGEVAYDDPVPVPLADLTTGDPISHATFGVSLDVLKSRILWSWPEHITPDDISFQAEGGLRLRDDANTSVCASTHDMYRTCWSIRLTA